MKLTKSQLKRLIKEELQNILEKDLPAPGSKEEEKGRELTTNCWTVTLEKKQTDSKGMRSTQTKKIQVNKEATGSGKGSPRVLSKSHAEHSAKLKAGAGWTVKKGATKHGKCAYGQGQAQKV